MGLGDWWHEELSDWLAWLGHIMIVMISKRGLVHSTGLAKSELL